MVNIFKAATNAINKAEETILCIVLIEMAFLAFIQVVLRYVFGESMTWAEELLRYQICFVTFFGADIGIKHGSHIGAELLNYIVPQRFKPLLKAFVFFSIFVFCAFLCYYGVLLVINVKLMGQITASMRLPKYLIYLPIPIAGFFMCVRCLFYSFAEVGKFITDLRLGQGAAAR